MRVNFSSFTLIASALLLWDSHSTVYAEKNDARPEITQPHVFSICTDGARQVLRNDKITGTIAQLPFDLLGKDSAQAGRTGAGLCGQIKAGSERAIKIRRRGFSSDRFAKKQYQVDFVDSAGADVETSLLGLPESDEWVFYGPYVDRSYIRNSLAYLVGAKIGALRGDKWAAPQFRFIELYLNDRYLGLYMLTEKIQRGKKHVAIPKTDLSRPDEPSYILEISAMTADFKTKYHTSLEYVYPGRKKLEAWQEQDPQATATLKQTMRKEVEFFERKLRSANFHDSEVGYRHLIDVESFVDYFLIREVFKDIDGFRRSAYFYKGTDHRFHMGPLWDFNIAFGNLHLFLWGMSTPRGWVHRHLPFYPKATFWFRRLLKDPYFVDLVQRRYAELRQPGMPLDAAVLGNDINSMVTTLGDTPERDRQRWRGTFTFIQKKVLNTKRKGTTHAEHVAILEDWLARRLEWLDVHIFRLGSK